MNIHHTLAKIGADEYEFLYQPFSGLGAWSLSFTKDGQRFETQGATIQGCVSSAVATVRALSSVTDVTLTP